MCPCVHVGVHNVCAHVHECSYTLTLAVVLAGYVHVCICVHACMWACIYCVCTCV